MSPEIYSHVARYLESCRPKFQNAQKDSKNARVKCETQVVRFAVVFTEIVNLTKLIKNLISVTVWFLLLFYMLKQSILKEGPHHYDWNFGKRRHLDYSTCSRIIT